MTKLEAFAAAVAICSAFFASPVAAGPSIDSFDGPAGGQLVFDTLADGTSGVSALAGQPTLGGSREIFVTKFGPEGSSTPVKASSNEFGTGVFNFDEFSSTAQGMARLVYDGAADGAFDPAGLAAAGVGVDLTQAGADLGLLFTDVRAVGSGLQLTANLYDALTGFVFTSGPVELSDGFAGDLFLPYASFFGPGGSSTPRNVGAIEFLIDGTLPGSDLTFELASSAAGPPVVPEPGSLALLATGGVGLVGGWHRKRRTTVAA